MKTNTKDTKMKTATTIIINIALIFGIVGIVTIVSAIGWGLVASGYGLFGLSIVAVIVVCGVYTIIDIVGKVIDRL